MLQTTPEVTRGCDTSPLPPFAGRNAGAGSAGLPRARIAHLSDVHMLEQRPGRTRASYGLGTQFVSIGRAMDSEERGRKLARAVAAARAAGSSHYVFSGDLTELGTPLQYEAFAEALHRTGLPPERVTLVPGNHDSYSGPDAWKKALEGPLKPYAKTSAGAPGEVVEAEHAFVLPVDVALHQPVTRSAGELTEAVADALERRLGDPAFRTRPTIIVQHHPPFPHERGLWQWVDGLRGWQRMLSLLRKFPHAHLLHGHLHYSVDRVVRGALAHARVFGAPAVVDDATGQSRVRVYETHGGALTSAGVLEA